MGPPPFRLRRSMAYLSLYRKYRSQTFDELAGQDHVTRTLQNAIRGGRIAHAYLFCGPRGTGKTSTARLLAKALNCEQGPTPSPCNTCDACQQITEGRHLDVKEIDAASHRGIEDIRDLQGGIAFAPVHGRYKVYVIDEAHQVTGDAFNAFLKTLEEPPPHVVFVLATTEAFKLPATIVSRCQKFDFRRGSLELLRERIAYVAREEGTEMDGAAVDLVAREANGGWRDALSLLEQVLAFTSERVTAKDVYSVLGTVEADTLLELAGYVLEGDGAAVWRLLEEVVSAGKDPRQLLRDLTAHFRGLMLAGAGAAVPGEPEHAARMAQQAQAYGQRRLVTALEILAQTDREARWSEQPRLLLEVAIAKLMLSGRGATAEPAVEASPRPQPARETRPSTVTKPEPTSRPATVPAPRGAETSPFIDDAPQPTPAVQGRDRASDGSAWLPPPPLTVGDARTGDTGDEEDFDALFGSRSPAPAAPTPPPVPARGAPRRDPGPAPATNGAAAGAAAVAPASPELNLIRQKWRLISEELKRQRKMTVHACLTDTQPDRLEGDTLVIAFPNETMARMFADRGKAFSEPLIEAIRSLTGATVKVRPEIGKGGTGGPGGVGGTKPAAPAPRPTPPAAATSAQPLPSSSAQVTLDTGPAVTPQPEPTAPAAPRPSVTPSPGSPDLVHDVIDVFDGSVVNENELS